jgi:PadR family transcriptional regulator PadR
VSSHDNRFDYHYNVMVMAADTYLGEFEQLILLAVMRLEDDAYGATIGRLIEEATGRRISIGAIYTTLDRLQSKGYLRSRIGDPTGERGGRRRKIYSLDRLGHLAITRAFAAWTNMTRGLKPKLA